MKIKTTYERLFKLKMFLEGSPGIRGIKFLMVIEKNIKKIERIERKLFRILKLSEGYKKFLERAGEINLKYCHRDKDGNPVFKETATGTKFSIKRTQRELFNKEHDELEKEFEKYIVEYQEQCDRYNEMLTKEVTIRFKTIAQKDIMPGHSELLMQRMSIFIRPTVKQILELYKYKFKKFINQFKKEEKKD